MKHPFPIVFAASLLAIASLGAMAQPTSPDGGSPVAQRPASPMGMQGPMDPARMEEQMAKRHAALKAKLKLSPEQEGAWTNFAQSMKPMAKAQPAYPDQAELAKLSTPERIDRMRALRNERMAAMQAAMDKRDDAVKTFYATLNSEQRKTFDAEHARMGAHQGKQRGMRHGAGAQAAQ